MRFKTKTKECHLIVKVKTSLGEHIDEKELDRFARVYLRGFMKPRVVKKNQAEYIGPVGQTLYERLKKPVSKRDFFFIMEHIVVAVQKLRSNNLSLNHLVADIHYAYINEVTKEVQFLYVPLTESKSVINVMQFMESIIYSAKPMQEKDMEYVSRFVYFLKGLKVLDVAKIEDYIMGEDRSVVDTIKKHNAGQSGFMTNKQQHYYEHYDKEKEGYEEATGLLGEEYEEATGLLSEEYEEATGLLHEEYEEATGLLYEQAEEATSLLNNDVEEGTTLLMEDNFDMGGGHFASLFRVSTEETIQINKLVYRIGKERSCVDYCISDNNTISRSHAEIIIRGKNYFVSDLNSKNHTYINEQLLTSHCETEIHDGDRLKLANEEFVFHV